MHTIFQENEWTVEIRSRGKPNSLTHITYFKEKKEYRATIKVTEVKHHAHYLVLGTVQQTIDEKVVEENKAEFKDLVKRTTQEHARYLELESFAYGHAEILRKHIEQAYFNQDEQKPS